MSRDYAEILLQAVDTLYNKKIESIKFNTTDTATIVEVSNAAEGKYLVSTGTLKYTAYSVNTTYRVGDTVYVTIPNGDYEKQKIIIGKQVTDNSESFTYIPPFNTMVNISENLITNTSNINGSLIANYYYDKSDDIIKEQAKLPDGKIQYKIWERIFDKENLIGYTRLGIQGQFRSWLDTWKTSAGDYGLKLVLTYEVKNCESYLQNYKETLSRLNDIILGKERINNWNWIINSSLVEIQDNQTINDAGDLIAIVNDLLDELHGTRTLIFSCSDFYGDPYNFNTFFEQEAVFDISSLGDEALITKMELYFYQVPKTFFSKSGNPIPYYQDGPFGQEDLMPNLFIKDPYVCLGYEVGAFTEDNCSLYTIDSLTYSYRVPDNYTEEDWLKKTIQLRWIHKFPDGQIKEIKRTPNFEELNYEIRWYRYELGAPSPDTYAGVHWKRITRTDSRSFSYEVCGRDKINVKLPEEKFKVIILLFSLDDDEKEYCIDIYRSNTLVFTNEDQVVSDSIIEQLNGFFIQTNDNSDGNYFVYGQSGDIKEQADPWQIRQIQCFFRPNGRRVANLLTNATKIIWRFPAQNSMLTLANTFGLPNSWENDAKSRQIDNVQWELAPGFDINEYGKEIQNYPLETQGLNHGQIKDNTVYHVSWSGICYDATTKEYVIGFKGDPSFAYFINPCLSYYIKSIYQTSYTSNTITCEVEKDGKIYTAYKTMRFGPAGTNGSAFTLVVNFDSTDNSALVLTQGTSESVKVTATLLDENRKEKTEFSGNYVWEWLPVQDNSCLPTITQVTTASGHNETITLNHSPETALNEVLLYLKCTLKNFGNYELVAVIPIAVRSSKNYLMTAGPTLVTYQSSGYPRYYRGPYQMQKNDNGWEVMNNVTWEIFNPNGVLTNFLGQIKTPNNTLSPCGIYVKEAGQYGVQCKLNGATLWTQPIYCCINEYPSTTLNEWNGKGIEINEENGTIVAPAIAAGKKNNDNTFSGVMLGDWKKNTDTESSISEQTGIYGLNHGSMSYAFKEDGTAFIGKSGMGRILFDGTNSVIQSESYQQNSGGMQIDLDDGIIDILGTIKTARNKVLLENNGGAGYYKSQNTYAPSGSEVKISANGPTYLSVKTENNKTEDNENGTTGKEILHVGSNSYFLKSDNFSTSPRRGTKIDLINGNVILAGSITWSSNGDNKPYQVLYSKGDRHQAYVVADGINSSNFTTNRNNLYVKYDGEYKKLSEIFDSSYYNTFDAHRVYYKEGEGKSKYYYTAPDKPSNIKGYQAFLSPSVWHSDFVNYDTEDPYGSDNYYSVSYNGGESWSLPQAINGHFNSSNLLASLLNNQSIDGIYNNGTDIGIRAAAIRTGFLYSREGNLATTDNTFAEISSKVNFTLDLDEGKINLHNSQGDYLKIGTGNTDGISLGNGAFTVTANGNLTLQDPGATNVFKISPKGNISATINGNSLNNLVIQSGTTFGVTKEGKLYSSSGDIGGFSIGEKYLIGGFTNNQTWGEQGAVLLLSKNQDKNRGVYYKHENDSDNILYAKTWRLLIGHDKDNIYNFGVAASGNVFANKIFIPRNALYIDNQRVTIKNVQIPVRFEVEPIPGTIFTGTYTASDPVETLLPPTEESTPWGIYAATNLVATTKDNVKDLNLAYEEINILRPVGHTKIEITYTPVFYQGIIGYTPKITEVMNIKTLVASGSTG